MFQTERLKQLRKKKKLSQATVAEDLNLTREAYSMYETGKRQPSCENLVALSQYYQVSADYLIGLSDVSRPLRHLTTKEQLIFLSLPYLDDLSIDFILTTIQFRYPHLTSPDAVIHHAGPAPRQHSASSAPSSKRRNGKRPRKPHQSVQHPKNSSSHNKPGSP